MTHSQSDQHNPDSNHEQSPTRENGNSHSLTPWKPNGRRPTGRGDTAAPRGKVVDSTFDKASPADLSALWAALRRRWFLASFLGLTFACISAGLTWMLMPTKYTTFSELFISSRVDSIIWEQHESEKAFEIYKQTNMKLVGSPFVLHAALRRPEINNLAIINEQENPLKWLEEELRVSSPQTEFIKISLTSTYQRDATALVNAITEAYLEEAVNQERNKKLQRKSYLERVNRENEEKLRNKRNTLAKLTETLQTSDPDALTDRQKMQIELLSQTRREHTSIRFELMRYQAQLVAKETNIDDAEEVDIPELVIEHQVLQDPEVMRLEKRKKDLDKLIARTQQTIKDDDSPILANYRADLELISADLEAAKSAVRPSVIETIKAEKQILTKQTITQLKSQIDVLKQHEQQLAAEIEEQEESTKNYGIFSYDMKAIKQDIEQQEEVAKKLSEEQQKIEIELSQPSRIALHRKAEVPSEPEMRQKYMMTAFAGFGVLALIVSGIVWLESAARRISTIKEVTNGLQMPVMGSLPVMPNWLVQGKAHRRNGRSAIWQSVWTESIDSARTMMLRDAGDEARQVVMVASAMSGEGKTTLSSHLATSLARAGRKTLLIDCDLRRPSIHKMFNLSVKPGICEVMRGEIALEDAIQMSPQENLYVLTAGHLTQMILQMLSQGDISTLFDQLRSHFDYIIVDSSPVLPVTDSMLVGQYVDAVIFSIRRDISRYAKVAAAYQRLSMLGIPVLGAVVIGLDEETYGSLYPYRYGYSRNYHYHYYNTPPDDAVEEEEDRKTTAETAES